MDSPSQMATHCCNNMNMKANKNYMLNT